MGMEREMTPGKHVLKVLSDGGGWCPEEKTGYRVLGNAWMEGAAVGSEVRRGSRGGDAAKTQKVKWDSREKSWGRAFQQDERPGQGPWVGMNLACACHCTKVRESRRRGGQAPARPQGLHFGKHLCGSKHLFRAGNPPTCGRKCSLCNGEGVRNDANNASLMTLGEAQGCLSRLPHPGWLSSPGLHSLAGASQNVEQEV